MLLNTSAFCCIIVVANAIVLQWVRFKGYFWEVTFAAQLKNCKANASACRT